MFYSVYEAEDSMRRGGGEGRVFFSPAVLMYYASYCSAYFKGLLDMMYIYKTKMVLSACSRLYFLAEVSMNACEDHTPSAKCGGWLPRARGRKRGRRRGDAGLQEGCVCERKTFAKLDGGRSGLHRDSDKRDHILSQILSVVCLHMFLSQ